MKKANALQILLGTTVDPFTSWLVQRGIRTMDLRVQKADGQRRQAGQGPGGPPRRAQVHHPSLETHPQHALAKRILKHGFGGMLSFVMPDDRKRSTPSCANWNSPTTP